MTNVFVDKFSKTARRDTFRSVSRRTARGAACASLLGAVALTMFSGGANAATATGTLAVSATVVSGCTVTGGALDFGSVDTGGADSINQYSTLTVKCSNSTGYFISLSSGLNGGTSATRKLKSGTANLLPYQLYKDAGRSQIWGSGGPENLVGTGTGVATSLNVYGTLSGLTTAVPGAYSDTVTVTVTY